MIRQYVRIKKYEALPTMEGCIGFITGEDDLQWFVRFIDGQNWSGVVAISKNENLRNKESFEYISEEDVLQGQDFTLDELQTMRSLLAVTGKRLNLTNNTYKMIMEKLNYKINNK